MGDVRGGSRRARMILQHKIDWIRGDRFSETFKAQATAPEADTVTARLEGMRDRLLAMADSVGGQKLEYSQQG